QQWTVSWLDSAGQLQPLFTTPGAYSFPRLSPDGRLLALRVSSAEGGDIYLYDRGRESMSRLTFTGNAQLPVWAPDGKHIALQAGKAFWWMRSDGTGEPQKLLTSQENIVPWSFSPDGRRLAFFESNKETDDDIWVVPLDTSDPDHPKPGKPELFLRTAA